MDTVPFAPDRSPALNRAHRLAGARFSVDSSRDDAEVGVWMILRLFPPTRHRFRKQMLERRRADAQEALAQLELAQERFRTLEATLDNRASVVVVAAGVVIAANLGQSSMASELAALIAVFGAASAAITAVFSLAYRGRHQLTSLRGIGALSTVDLQERIQLAAMETSRAESAFRTRQNFLVLAYTLVAMAFLGLAYNVVFETIAT